MRELTQNSPEYRSNGHYEIEGVDFMSVYTYKHLYRNDIDNEKSKNSKVTNEMGIRYGLPPYKGIMEFGEFEGEFVQLHKKTDLEEFLPRLNFKIKK